jgi:hypothetical protein
MRQLRKAYMLVFIRRTALSLAAAAVLPHAVRGQAPRGRTITLQ